jgi:hypothetical protein
MKEYNSDNYKQYTETKKDDNIETLYKKIKIETRKIKYIIYFICIMRMN